MFQLHHYKHPYVYPFGAASTKKIKNHKIWTFLIMTKSRITLFQTSFRCRVTQRQWFFFWNPGKSLCRQLAMGLFQVVSNGAFLFLEWLPCMQQIPWRYLPRVDLVFTLKLASFLIPYFKFIVIFIMDGLALCLANLLLWHNSIFNVQTVLSLWHQWIDNECPSKSKKPNFLRINNS